MDYFSFEDVMKELELGEEELKRMVSEGELRAFRDENKMKFKKEDVESLKKGRIFAEDFLPGFTDGMRIDTKGNVWCSMGWADPREDGVRCYNPAGVLIGKVHLPETCANLCFGGQKRNRLFMAASTSIYALYVDIQGAQLP